MTDPMHAPDFWQTDLGPWPRLLAPLGCLYRAIGRIRHGLCHPQKAGIPVICIGNLTAGGAGKTPIAIALGTLLSARGIKVHFLSRGYGGKVKGPLRVNPATDSAEDVGDEPLLLVRTAPTWISRDRARGAEAAAKEGAECLILDDGHQDPRLEKDLSLIVIDGETGFGNGRVIPAGPLRETVDDGLARAQGVIIMGKDRLNLGTRIRQSRPDLPILSATLQPEAETDAYRGKKLLGFAGIGRPEKFRKTLLALGAELEAFHPYPDHHAYTAKEINTLIKRARDARASIVTTAKDHVRLDREQREKIGVVEVKAVFADEQAVEKLLAPLTASWAAQEGPDQDASGKD